VLGFLPSNPVFLRLCKWNDSELKQSLPETGELCFWQMTSVSRRRRRRETPTPRTGRSFFGSAAKLRVLIDFAVRVVPQPVKVSNYHFELWAVEHSTKLFERTVQLIAYARANYFRKGYDRELQRRIESFASVKNPAGLGYNCAVYDVTISYRPNVLCSTGRNVETNNQLYATMYNIQIENAI